MKQLSRWHCDCRVEWKKMKWWLPLDQLKTETWEESTVELVKYNSAMTRSIQKKEINNASRRSEEEVESLLQKKIQRIRWKICTRRWSKQMKRYCNQSASNYKGWTGQLKNGRRQWWQVQHNERKNHHYGQKDDHAGRSKQHRKRDRHQGTRRAEPEKSRNDRIPRRHDRTRSTRHIERNHNYDRNVNGPITDAEERFHQKRFGYFKCCIHTKTQCTTRTDQNEQMDKTCIVNGEIVIWTCATHISRHRSWSRRDHGKSDGKKIVAPTVSSRIVGIRRRMEGMTTCSQNETRHTMNKKTKGWREKVGANRVSHTFTVTFQCSCLNKKQRCWIEIEEDLKGREVKAEADNVIVTLTVTYQSLCETKANNMKRA